MYTLELLQSINDWQSMGFGKSKVGIAERILQNSKDIPEVFKSITSPCYRQVALTGINSVLLGANMQLPETYSSWTFDKAIAQNFNGGVPAKGYQGVIFVVENTTANFEVVINLFELFKDADFLAACKKYKDQINSYNTGIGHFMNKESEVILKIDKITTADIWAYGGYSAPKEELAQMYFRHKPSDRELKYFDKLIKNANVIIGGNWVTGEAKDRIVKLHVDKAKELTQRRS